MAHFIIVDGKKKLELIPLPAGTKKSEAIKHIRERWNWMSPRQRAARESYFLMEVGSKKGQPDYTGPKEWKMVEMVKEYCKK